MFNFLWRRESKKETSTLPKAPPYMEGMQPLLLSLLHFGKLRPSQVWLEFLIGWRIWEKLPPPKQYASNPFLAISLSPSVCWGSGNSEGNWILLFLYVFNLKPPGR